MQLSTFMEKGPMFSIDKIYDNIVHDLPLAQLFVFIISSCVTWSCVTFPACYDPPPSGYESYPDISTLVAHYTNDKDYADSMSDCQSENARLFMIDTKEEYDIARSIMSE